MTHLCDKGKFRAMKRFSSLPDAKRYIYQCLWETLDNDLHTSAGYIFNDDFSERDRVRVIKAARQVLDELHRKAQPRGRGR